MILLAIDPGLRACGCALFKDGVLLRAALVKNPEKKLRGPQAHVKMAGAVSDWSFSYTENATELALEYPRVYPNHSNKRSEDPNDLLELAGVDAAIAMQLGRTFHIRHYFPADWKGQLPANQCARQILGELSEAEENCIENLQPFLVNLASREAAGKQVSHSAHNTIDAVGVGLHHLSRF